MEKKARDYKANWSLYPLEHVEKAIQIITQGRDTHPDEAWESITREENFAALMRHLVEVRAGATVDAVSGYHPVYHVLARALFLAAQVTDSGDDD